MFKKQFSNRLHSESTSNNSCPRIYVRLASPGGKIQNQTSGSGGWRIERTWGMKMGMPACIEGLRRFRHSRQSGFQVSQNTGDVYGNANIHIQSFTCVHTYASCCIMDATEWTPIPLCTVRDSWLSPLAFIYNQIPCILDVVDTHRQPAATVS